MGRKYGCPWEGRGGERSWKLAEGIKRILCLRIVHDKLKNGYLKKGVSESLFFTWKRCRNQTQISFVHPFQRQNSWPPNCIPCITGWRPTPPHRQRGSVPTGPSLAACAPTPMCNSLSAHGLSQSNSMRRKTRGYSFPRRFLWAQSAPGTV